MTLDQAIKRNPYNPKQGNESAYKTNEKEREGMKLLKIKKRIEIDKTIGNINICTFNNRRYW